MTQNADQADADYGRVIAYVDCPVCCGYRRKLHIVRGRPIASLIRAEYKVHLVSHDGRSEPWPRTPILGDTLSRCF